MALLKVNDLRLEVDSDPRPITLSTKRRTKHIFAGRFVFVDRKLVGYVGPQHSGFAAPAMSLPCKHFWVSSQLSNI